MTIEFKVLTTEDTKDHEGIPQKVGPSCDFVSLVVDEFWQEPRVVMLDSAFRAHLCLVFFGGGNLRAFRRLLQRTPL
ncbi:MAG: hypothetical protein ACXWC5_31940, partial [Burkholderiales bacterium]